MPRAKTAKKTAETAAAPMLAYKGFDADKKVKDHG
jgi:hypothetical protein